MQTQQIAVLAVAFAQASTGEVEAMDAGEIVMTHRIRLEFWIKHTQGLAAATMQRGRDVATDAAVVILANDGTGYELTPGTFEEAVDPQMVQHNQAAWLVSVLTVPVRNVIAVGD